MNVNGFLDKNPFVRIILPFILGIILHRYADIPAWLSCMVLCSFLAFAIILNRDSEYKKRWMCGAMLFVSILALGSASATLSAPRNIAADTGGRKCEYRACVTNTPTQGEKACKADLRVEAVNIMGQWHDFDARIVATIMKDSAAVRLKAGQTIVFSSKIDSLDMPKNPFGFDYSQYLQLNGVQGSIFLNNGEWHLADDNVRGLKQHALNVRQLLVGQLEKAGLEGNELGLASTLVLGYKSNIDAEVKQAYMNAGAMHVLAVSGLHVGIVCTVLEFLMMLLGGNIAFRFKRIVIVLLLWAYVFITGLSPSVLRATVMFSFVEIGRLIKREMSIYNTLAASALLLLTINPDMLFKAGFQLSYAAVLGIVSLQPRIVGIVRVSRGNKPLRWLWELTAVSIAAQISTLPFCLYYFERTPVYFWMSNVIVSPGAGIMIGLTLLLFAASPFEVVAKAVGVVVTYAAKSMNGVVRAIANLQYSTIENTYISIFQAFMIGVVVLAALIWLMSHNGNWLLCSLTALLLFQLPFSISSIRNSSIQALCVYYSPRNSLAQFVDGSQSYWVKNAIGDSQRAGQMVKGGNIFWNTRWSETIDTDSTGNNGCMISQNGFFMFDSICGLIVDGNTHRFRMKKPMTIDYLIVSGNPQIRARQMPETLQFKNVIIDGSVPPWTVNEWVRRYPNSAIHNIRKQGAYIHRFVSVRK